MSEIKAWGAKAAVIAMLLCLAQANALADFTFDIGGSATRAFYPGAAARGTDHAVDLDTFSLATLLSYYQSFDFDNRTRGSGSFDLSVTDFKASNFPPAWAKGRITNVAASPEPSAILLTAAFMSGVMVLFRKRLGNS
jgi:hypothetical protein